MALALARASRPAAPIQKDHHQKDHRRRYVRTIRNRQDQAWGLYFEIQSLNDYGTESLSALLYAVERLRSVVRAGDEPGFAALMERGREYLGARTR